MKSFVTKENKTGGNDSGTATSWGANEQNSVNDELVEVVETTGQTPTVGTGPDPTPDQLSKALTIVSQTANSYQDTGVANAYVLSPTGLLAQASVYFEGEIITFETANPNTGATTVNKVTLGVKKVLLFDGTELSGGELLSNRTIFLKYDSAADGGGGAYKFISDNDLWAQNNILHIQDQKAISTDGGDFNTGAPRTRDLNTIITNTIPGASLSVNQITLPSGTYCVMATAPARSAGQHQSTLYNVTDAIVESIGTSMLASAGDAVTIPSVIKDEVTITATKVFEVRHECSLTRLANGFGQASNFNTEVYTDIFIAKIG